MPGRVSSKTVQPAEVPARVFTAGALAGIMTGRMPAPKVSAPKVTPSHAMLRQRGAEQADHIQQYRKAAPRPPQEGNSSAHHPSLQVNVDSSLLLCGGKQPKMPEAGQAAPPLVRTNLRRLHHLLHPFFHLSRRHIFYVSSNAPQVPEGILDEAVAVSIELVLHRLQDFRSLRRRFFHHAIDVG